MNRKYNIEFWVLEVVILISTIVTSVFLYGLSINAIMLGTVIGLVYGIVLSISIILTYNAIKARRLYFTIGGIITTLFMIFALVSIIFVPSAISWLISWLMNITLALFIIDVLYIFIALSISYFKK